MLIKTVFKNKKNSGYAILFTVLIVSMILAMTVGISNTTYRELSFTATAKQSHIAFFAADSGLECALWQDRNTAGSTVFPFNSATASASTMDCFASTPPTIAVVAAGATSASYLVQDFAAGGGCVRVTVEKDQNAVPPASYPTRIVARGYNINCSDLALGKQHVERVLQAKY